MVRRRAELRGKSAQISFLKLVRRVVSVEKVDFFENRLEMDDQKCICGRGKSFIGHRSASTIPGSEFFNSHAI